ncbi:mechanosensitive ion channel family protein [Nostoc sp. UCD121]|uniref:mechanosensitive ion channel family protein n=1 Tax=unclassified Nostoc TaxID=2593658 RepID=UPI0016238168|nr:MULTISPECIES: mechanosensitive ion channel family protein [unclassified Nostoc]MBC1221317.1 mechanosensitive ion channel family protein [Nostoc sp. UCD120]MBC1275017.1 mechanosensitive ion channel family protein [Nostoc sp. UCD121]MBC1293689.1 mechanosensitive ion channel family protein [Nostoc sp. UCD122]
MRFQFLAIASSMAIAVVSVPKATAQIPFLPQLQAPSSVSSDSNNRLVTGWIYLDGRRLFQIAASRANFPERSEDIQKKLEKIAQNYFQSPPTTAVNVNIPKVNQLPVIYVNGQYLMTITSEDAGLREVDTWTSANQIAESLQEDLQQAKQERQTQFLINQGKIAAGTGLAMIIMSWGIYSWQRRSKKDSAQSIASQPLRWPLNSPISPVATQPITTQLNQQQHRHIQEVKRRLFQLTQAGIWGGGSFFILGLFPYTRPFQLGILTAAQFPLRLGVVFLVTYVAIRLIYALIDRFTTTLISSGALLTPESSERLQLRVSTFSGVTKSIATGICVGVGFLLALVSLGIDIVPLLAGASLVGVAVSLASQNLIKDAINGFLIILEDQYALGDVINVGNVGGLVENLNLRMTQLRDSEGRLITIPNSEIKIVANLSSRWSRADLTVPIAYQADTEHALKLIETVAFEMNQEMQWQRQILEPPQVLGIDQFGDRGLIIRVWFKTQPLKQWDVAREFRRRLKVALDKAGISISVPQQAIWVNDDQLLNFQGNGKAH